MPNTTNTTENFSPARKGRGNPPPATEAATDRDLKNARALKKPYALFAYGDAREGEEGGVRITQPKEEEMRRSFFSLVVLRRTENDAGRRRLRLRLREATLLPATAEAEAIERRRLFLCPSVCTQEKLWLVWGFLSLRSEAAAATTVTPRDYFSA